MYKIEAHTNENGNIEDQTTPEFLGDAYGVEYLTLGEAKSKALDLESDLEAYGLPASTVYTVHEDGGAFPVWSTKA